MAVLTKDMKLLCSKCAKGALGEPVDLAEDWNGQHCDMCGKRLRNSRA